MDRHPMCGSEGRGLPAAGTDGAGDGAAAHDMDPALESVALGSVEHRDMDVGGTLVTHLQFAAGTSIPYHAHARPVLSTILEGRLLTRIRGRWLECTAGTLLTEPPGEGHENGVGTTGARTLVLQPDPRDDALMEVVGPLLDRVSASPNPAIETAALELLRELRHTDVAAGLARESLVLEILARAARAFEAPGRGRPPAWLDRGLEMLRDRLRDPPSLSEVAEECGVSPSHFAHVFKGEFGMTVGQYGRRLRMEWAASQLRETDTDLSALALRAGFSDQSHFTRAFKRHFGVPPGAFRSLRDAD